MKTVQYIIKSSALALLAMLLPSGLLAKPIIIRINDVPLGAPVIQVQGAPNGYNTYMGDIVADPAIEDGALITLPGVDTGGSIPDWDGRFVLPSAPEWFRTGTDIIWVTHDVDIFGNGDLQVGFNSALPGTYYFNPEFTGSQNLGLVTDNWVQVYADDTIVVLFKPHTYRLRN